MNKLKIDRITIFYKIFLISLIAIHVYMIFFEENNIFTLIVESIMVMYLLFRLYLLFNLKKRAEKFSLTLPEFLNRFEIKGHVCKRCGHIS